MNDFTNRLTNFKKLFTEADYVLLGAGAGLSTAAGFEYSGELFHKYFADFINKYHFTDMYTAGFYPFKTEEEKWAYWSRYVFFNRYKSRVNPLYSKLYQFLKQKDYGTEKALPHARAIRHPPGYFAFQNRRSEPLPEQRGLRPANPKR